MKAVVISRIPILKQCRNFFRLEYGMIDYDVVIDFLCEGIEGKASDRDYIRDMVYSDIFFQGHHEPYSEHLKTKMFRFLISLRSDIVGTLLNGGRISHHAHFRFCPQFKSSMSLTFQVF